MSRKVPKRKHGRQDLKGSKVMQSYIKFESHSETEWSRTCSSSGCSYDTGFPRVTSTNTKMQGVTVESDASNSASLRHLWKSRSYFTCKAWGGHRSRYLGSSYSVYVGGVFSHYVKYQKGYYHFPSAYASSVSVTEPVSQRNEANAIAQAKLNSSLKEARTQWNLAVTLGEARETAAMLAHSARRLANAFLAFKRGRIVESWRQLRGKPSVPVHHQENFRSLKRRAQRDTWVDEVASAWMEYSYGWKPLLGDIDSAAKYLAEKHVRGYFPVQEVSRAHRIRGTQRSKNPLNPGSGLQYEDLYWINTHYRYTYELYPDWAYRPSTLNELGFTDPYSLAWELLPLSFVTDWFVNVGQVLESLHEFRQWGVKRGISSYGTSQLRETSLIKNWSDLSVETYPPQYQKYKWCRRQTLSSLPTAVPLRIKVENPFDLKHGQMASAAALLRFAFR